MSAVMVFGIGINFVSAATATKPTATTNTSSTKTTPINSNGSQSLQPATGNAEYRTMDGNANTAGAEVTQAASESGAPTAEENTGIVGMFGLNWKLFVAQLINFAIILFVLWKWVWSPVTKGLAQRTEKIENSLEDAQKISQERETFDSWKQGEISQVRAEAASIISQAKSDAEKVKSDLLDKTKEEQAKLIAAAQVKLEQEKQMMVESAKTELAGLVVGATEKILKQKLDAKKDAALIEDALKEAKHEV